jgi:Tol biopolymer transport system component
MLLAASAQRGQSGALAFNRELRAMYRSHSWSNHRTDSTAPSVLMRRTLVAQHNRRDDRHGRRQGAPLGFAWRPQVVVLALAALFMSGCAFITRASLDTAGGDPDNASFDPSISADGRYVTFWSAASDLVSGDDSGFEDVFVRDLKTGTTIRASVDMGGDDPNGDSFFPSISGDGRFVAFASRANDLVAGDSGSSEDIFVRDLQTATTTRVTVDTGGGDPDAGTRHAWISGDGGDVVFASPATDLVPGDGNGVEDVFLRDLVAGTTTRVSVDSSGGDSNGPSGSTPMFVPSAISADGRFVAFFSDASDLVSGDGNGLSDVFLRDLQSGLTTRVNVDAGGGDPNGRSDWSCSVHGQSISADGRYVAFCSYASDVVPGDGNGTSDVFVRDRLTGTTTRVSLDTAGGDPNNGSCCPSISADGRLVAFFSGATDLVPNDGNGTLDVFVRDRPTGTTTRVSVNLLGREANGTSAGLISADGRYVAFHSDASNLVGSDGNGAFDIYVRAVVTPTVDSVTPPTVGRGSTATLTVTGSGFFSGARASPQAFGPYGLTVNSVAVISETELELSVTVDAAAPTGSRNVIVWNPGTGPGVFATGFGFCFGCLTVT